MIPLKKTHIIFWVIVVLSLFLALFLAWWPNIANADSPIRFTQSKATHNTAFVYYYNEYYQPHSSNNDETKQKNYNSVETLDSDQSTTLPSRYMLSVDKLTATSVRNQGCMGACWAFGSIAAAESSLVNDKLADLSVDLSERHLALFAHTPIQFCAASLPSSQAQTKNGEGFAVASPGSSDSNTPSASWRIINLGGTAGSVYKMFATNQGPVSEAAFPYNEQAESTYTQSATGDWSIDPSQRFVSLPYDLTDCNVLPPLYVYTKGTSQVGLNAIKNEINQGRCVASAINVGTVPRELNQDSAYSNAGFSYLYNYDEQSINHEISIIGYDDSVSATLFSKVDANGNTQTPPANGAFLVKDSVGDTFGVRCDGSSRTPDQVAANTGGGYFWVSYYDKTMYSQQSYQFKPANGYQCYSYDYIANPTNIVGEYKTDLTKEEYLKISTSNESTASQSGSSDNATDNENNQPWVDDDGEADGPMYAANVYTAEQDLKICDISFETLGDTDTTTIEVRVFDKDKEGNTPNIDDARVVCSFSDMNYDLGGYHRVTLEEPVCIRQGDMFAIAISHKMDNGSYAIPYSSAKRTTTGNENSGYNTLGATVNCNSIINRGESLIFYNNHIEDLVDACCNLDPTYTYQNFTLNAYTTTATEQDFEIQESKSGKSWLSDLLSRLFDF